MPVGQCIVSSQRAACQERRHALLPISSQQLSPWLIANTLPLVFQQECSSVMNFSTVFLQVHLLFLHQGFNHPVRGITKMIFRRYSTFPTPLPARGRSQPEVAAGVQHEPHCLALPSIETSFAYLYFGAFLKGLSPGHLKLWKGSMCPPSRTKQGSYPSTRGTPTAVVLIPSTCLPSDHSPCLLPPTDIVTQSIKSLCGC